MPQRRRGVHGGKRARAGRKPSGKVSVNIRLKEETHQALRRAAATTRQCYERLTKLVEMALYKTVYTDVALKRFKTALDASSPLSAISILSDHSNALSR